MDRPKRSKKATRVFLLPPSDSEIQLHVIGAIELIMCSGETVISGSFLTSSNERSLLSLSSSLVKKFVLNLKKESGSKLKFIPFKK